MRPDYLPVVFLSVVLAALGAFAQDTPPQRPDMGGDCSVCHSSGNPGLEDLIPTRRCARPKSREKLDEAGAAAPDVVIIDQLSDIYVPVAFPHALHADMVAMADGCGTCHHHGEEGKIVSCRACHNGGVSTENLGQPEPVAL